jgi:hypothetical protein
MKPIEEEKQIEVEPNLFLIKVNRDEENKVISDFKLKLFETPFEINEAVTDFNKRNIKIRVKGKFISFIKSCLLCNFLPNY